jgi:restriction system protein
MKFKMAKNSLFAVLLRSPWWVSVGVAVLTAGVAAAVLPPAYVPYGMFGAMPFVVTAAISGWRRLNSLSDAQVESALASAGSMAWPAFADALEKAWRRDGHAVERLARGGADFELTKAGRTTLVSCKRWKAARTGIEPLRELHAAQLAREAARSIYISNGELSDNARQFAADNGIHLLQGSELALLLRDAPRRHKEKSA